MLRRNVCELTTISGDATIFVGLLNKIPTYFSIRFYHGTREEMYMLTAKENMREVIRGGNPDRFVNQFEAIALLFHPYLMTQPLL